MIVYLPLKDMPWLIQEKIMLIICQETRSAKQRSAAQVFPSSHFFESKAKEHTNGLLEFVVSIGNFD